MKTTGDIISVLFMILALSVASVVMMEIGIVLPLAFLAGAFIAALILSAGILLANKGQEIGHTPDR